MSCRLNHRKEQKRSPPALPAPRRICTAEAAPAPARSSAPDNRLRLVVVPREGRSRRAVWTGGPSRRLGGAVHPPWRACAGRGGRVRRGAPPGAPRLRSPAPRGAAGPSGGIFTFRRRSLAVAARADFVHFVFGLFAAFVSTIYMRKRKVIILVF